MTLLLANWKLILIGILAAMLGLMTNLYLEKRDDLAVEKANFFSFVSRVDELGKDAEAKREADVAEQLKNLEKVKATHENLLPQVRADAVANYLAHRVRTNSRPSADSGAVRWNGPGISLDDGAVRECVPDETFIRSCAEDASKVGAFQEYCQRNRCPVE